MIFSCIVVFHFICKVFLYMLNGIPVLCGMSFYCKVFYYMVYRCLVVCDTYSL